MALPTNWFMGPKVTPKQQDLRCPTGESLIKPEVQWWVSTYTVSTLGLNGVSGTLSVFFCTAMEISHIWMTLCFRRSHIYVSEGFPLAVLPCSNVAMFWYQREATGTGLQRFWPRKLGYGWVKNADGVFRCHHFFYRIIFWDDNDGDLKPLTRAILL